MQNFDAAKLRAVEKITLLSHFIKSGFLLTYVKKKNPPPSIISYKTHFAVFMEHSPLYKASNSPASPENP